MCVCVHPHRADHLADQHHGGPPVARGTGEDPLAVELQQELGARVDVHPCSMLPVWRDVEERGLRRCSGHLIQACGERLDLCVCETWR